MGHVSLAFLTGAGCSMNRALVSQSTTLQASGRDRKSQRSSAGSPSRSAVWKWNVYCGGWSGINKNKKESLRVLAIKQTLSKSQRVAYHCSLVARLFVLVLRANFLSAWRKKWWETNWTSREEAPSARLRRGALKPSVFVLKEASVAAGEIRPSGCGVRRLIGSFFGFFYSPKYRFSSQAFKSYSSDASLEMSHIHTYWRRKNVSFWFHLIGLLAARIEWP